MVVNTNFLVVLKILNSLESLKLEIPWWRKIAALGENIYQNKYQSKWKYTLGYHFSLPGLKTKFFWVFNSWCSILCFSFNTLIARQVFATRMSAITGWCFATDYNADIKQKTQTLIAHRVCPLTCNRESGGCWIAICSKCFSPYSFALQKLFL